MRNISASSLDKLATRHGTEPIIIIEVQWVKDGPRIAYADRDVDYVKGKILEISEIDAIISVSGGSDSQRLSVILDDTDGSLKSILDTQDVHKRPVWVYQWFSGIPLSDKFLLFQGQVNTPVTWKEGDRTVSFDIINKIEDAEVGFSIEEGDFPAAPDELIGKAWPLCFGTVVNVPALRLRAPLQGTLGTGVGIADFTLPSQIENVAPCPQVFKEKGFCYADSTYMCCSTLPGELPGQGTGAGPECINLLFFDVFEQDQQCLASRAQQIADLEAELDRQRQSEVVQIKVFGGEKFPRGTITLAIDGAHFIGFFGTGDTKDIFTITRRIHPDILKAIEEGKDLPTTSSAFFASPGAIVTLAADEEIIYAANLLPSTVLRVAAFRSTDNGQTELVTVPANYYNVRTTNYVGYQVTEVQLPRPLSRRDNAWDDETLYVTLTSSVGPNTVDVLEWLIDAYTTFDVDATSFAAVKLSLENYPSHFPILDRRNIIEVLEEIAFQARCAIWLRDDKFYLRYLSKEPDADDTFTVSDIDLQTVSVDLTDTEDLVTKLVATWQEDYSKDKQNRLILRHNVAKYGTLQEDYDFYIYNIKQLVEKSATFWLIRKSNTWRKVAFSTPLHKLRVEVFDTISLDVPQFASPVKCIVEKASYNSDTNSIDFEVWTPLKSGSTSPYVFAWPAAVDQQQVFPTPAEVDAGYAGGGPGRNFSMTPPPGHLLSRG